jgi:heterodisulfide reductase subunit A-like polyferredoxin
MNSFNAIKKRDNDTNSWENKTSGNKEPSWYTNIEQPIKFAKLANNIPSSEGGKPADVVVIGGGIAGLSTTYLVSKSGKKVVAIEDGYIGSGDWSNYRTYYTCIR